MSFDFYYGNESEQFSFYRIPRLLVTSRQFRSLSTDAKLLYGLLLDRMGLSAKNGWYDKRGRVFIYYTLDEIQEDFNCGHSKAIKLLSELDNGFGLIGRVKQGQGRPTMIYVKRFFCQDPPPQNEADEITSRLPNFGSQEFSKTEVKTSEKKKSRLLEIGSADFPKADTIYTESNQTDNSQLNLSIHPSSTQDNDWMDRYDLHAEIKDNLDYALLCKQYNREEVEEIVELICDTLCSTRPTLHIRGEEIPTEQVRDRFHRLRYEHVEYVFDCLHKNTTQIRNIRAYLLTALYNAPETISHYYRAAVQHDFGS